MAKNILQDVLTKDRRTIRHIPIPESRKEHIEKEPEKDESLKFNRTNPRIIECGGGHGYGRWLMWGIVGVSLVVLIVALSTIFTGATISITQKTEQVEINTEIRALSKGNVNDFLYSVLPVTKTGTETVLADGEEQVLKLASGTITVYNDFSTASQRLIKNTRFETKEGLIYRIDSSITVPGRVTKSGKTTPGSVEATVYADVPGDKYNIPLSDFTIPGFKNDPVRYAKFYARSKTPITGGFVGIQKVVSPDKVEAARTKIRNVVSEQVLAEARGQVDPKYIFYNNAYTINFESLPNTEAPDNKVIISEKAVLNAVVFNRESLSQKIADITIKNFNKQPVLVSNLDNLVFEIRNKKDFSATLGGPLLFSLKGSGKIVWTFDETKLKSELFGKPKKEIETVLSNYPAIITADVTIRPFWKGTFPTHPDKIKIVVK